MITGRARGRTWYGLLIVLGFPESFAKTSHNKSNGAYSVGCEPRAGVGNVRPGGKIRPSRVYILAPKVILRNIFTPNSDLNTWKLIEWKVDEPRTPCMMYSCSISTKWSSFGGSSLQCLTRGGLATEQTCLPRPWSHVWPLRACTWRAEVWAVPVLRLLTQRHQACSGLLRMQNTLFPVGFVSAEN